MSSTTEKFIRLYEDLIEEVNRRAGASSSHSFEIERAASRDGAVRKRQNLLKYIRDVRHAVQHPKHRSNGYAVLISESFLEEVEGLLNHLQNPLRSGSLGVPRKQIRTTHLSDRLGDLADEMRAGGFSNVPILDEDDVIVGVFNETAIFHYLWHENETIVGRGMLVREVIEHCRLAANRTETFRFVGPRVPLEDLADMFAPVESATTRLGAVFVTASGKDTERLERLITPWDVLGGVIE
ncbi:MAG: CBS domain-containing protein [Rhodospirillales bacterium]|jgi:CBS domain-containing protein